MLVSELLPKVKANNKTFKYIDGRDKQLFQRAYDYLKSHKDKEVNKIVETLINDYLRPVDMDFLIKYKAIQLISTNIKH
jgi:hypothetical protein